MPKNYWRPKRDRARRSLEDFDTAVDRAVAADDITTLQRLLTEAEDNVTCYVPKRSNHSPKS